MSRKGEGKQTEVSDMEAMEGDNFKTKKSCRRVSVMTNSTVNVKG